MTYGSERVLWKGDYGYINRVALTIWNAKNRNARAEYYKHPFINLKHHNNPVKPKREWRPREIRYLVEQRKKGVPFDKIAKHLKRSTSACQARAAKLGIVKKRSPRD